MNSTQQFCSGTIGEAGIDIVHIVSIERSLDIFGHRFVGKVFTAEEAAYCESLAGRGRAASYAARFAVKEAVMKILEMDELSFQEIELIREPIGRPTVRLHRRAADMARQLGLERLRVSVSHDGDYAIAVVVDASGHHVLNTPGANVVQEKQITPECRVPLLEEQEGFARIRQVFRHEVEMHGRPRNLTKVVAHSRAVWEATTRALNLYSTLRAIDRHLVDILCLYTSLLNGCCYCIDDAAGEALRSGWRAEQLLRLDESHCEAFDAATMAALRYARALSLTPGEVSDEIFDGLRAHYTDEAILEISTIVSMKNFWNRFATALRIPAEGKCVNVELLDGLLDLSRAMRKGTEDPHNA